MTQLIEGSVAQPDVEPIFSRWWRTVDHWSIGAIFVLFCLGLFLGLAASVPLALDNELSAFHYVQRHLLFGMLGLGVMFAFSFMTPKTVRRLSVISFGFAFFALLLLPVLGSDFGKGATRWYSLGFITLQPSEFVKPVFIVLTAWLMSLGQMPSAPPGRLLSFAILLCVAALLVMQPDYGQTALLMFGWGVVYFIAGAPMFFILLIVGAVGFGALLAYGTSSHFARRIDAYLSADVDPRSQIGYATNAIQEGGLWGVGIGEGQVKWQLADAHTDFIIAVAAEEYGLWVVFIIIGLYALIVIRALLRLMRERDMFARFAGVGLAALFGVQAMINMGVAVRLLPAKGMTLPFLSYGGSSLIAAGITMGMLLALTRMRPQGHINERLG